MEVYGLLTLVLAGPMVLVSSYPSGPPIGNSTLDPTGTLCATMLPGHDSNTGPPDVPFVIRTNQDCYNKDTVIQVIVELKNKDDEYHIEGIFLQARPTGDSTSDGIWDGDGNKDLAPNDCFTKKKNVLTHTAKLHDTKWLSVKWTPGTHQDDREIYATIVSHFDVYWVKVKSKDIKYQANCKKEEFLKEPTSSVPAHTITLSTLLTTSLLSLLLALL